MFKNCNKYVEVLSKFYILVSIAITKFLDRFRYKNAAFDSRILSEARINAVISARDVIQSHVKSINEIIPTEYVDYDTMRLKEKRKYYQLDHYNSMGETI